MAGMPLDGVLALVWFLVAWFGYTYLADHVFYARGLMGAASVNRRRWMEMMLKRDNRIVDTQIAATLSRNVSFFAQTSLFIIAGLIAALGAGERAAGVIADLPFASRIDTSQWELKLFLLIVVFTYGFFKFTWSMRLFNYLMTTIGGAPERGADSGDFAARATNIGDLAVDHFNRGIRGYYFGLAILPWFVHPLAFVASTTLVVAVLWRREFQSETLKAIRS